MRRRLCLSHMSSLAGLTFLLCLAVLNLLIGNPATLLDPVGTEDLLEQALLNGDTLTASGATIDCPSGSESTLNPEAYLAARSSFCAEIFHPPL